MKTMPELSFIKHIKSAFLRKVKKNFRPSLEKATNLACERTVVTNVLAGQVSDDRGIWIHETGAAVRHMCDFASSSEAFNSRVIRNFEEIIVPFLGPHPSRSDSLQNQMPLFASNVTDDHTPLEYSFSFRKGKTVIRALFDPRVPHPLLPGVLSSFHGVRSFLDLYSKKFELDLSCYDPVAPIFLKDETEILPILSANQPIESSNPISALFAQDPTRMSSQIMFTIDFRNEIPLLKAYFYPDAAASVRGVPKNKIIQEAFDALGMSASYKLLMGYLEEVQVQNPNAPAPLPELFSVDLVAKEKARIKVYVRYPLMDRSAVAKHTTLGGRLPSEHSDFALEVWDYFFEQSDDLIITERQNCAQERTAASSVYYDFRVSNPEKVVASKIDLPVGKYLPNDQIIIEKLDSFLDAHDMKSPSHSYLDLARSFLRHRSLSSRTGMISYFGACHRLDDSGNPDPELYVYFAPENYAPERTNFGTHP